MAKGYLRNGTNARATFKQAGGSKVFASHPKLYGQLNNTNYGTTTILVSSATELDSEYLTITPSLDASKMKITASGDTVLITNDVLAGTVTLRMLETTGEVATGDPVACFNAIRDSGDTQGWVFTIQRFINGKMKQTILSGCALVNMPRLIIAGNDVPTYEATFNYTNLIETDGGSENNDDTVWFVGNEKGINAEYSPFDITTSESKSKFTNLDIANGLKETADDSTNNNYSGLLEKAENIDKNPTAIKNAKEDDSNSNG